MAEILPRRKRLKDGGMLAKESAITLNTPNGRILGLAKDGVGIFRGVPFAAPPVGALRFLPPQPLQGWADVKDCTRHRDSAVAAGEIDPLISRSEDCLYLNIWAPEEAQGKNLPVLVFIHGGGFADGSPAKIAFDGTRFAKDGAVQVNVTYRLNALGFMPFEEVEAEHGAFGNIGLLDQIAALKWVQKNIASFGGNPNCVTVCGESAGAFSVSSLILSPLAKGLFCRAIMESGNILGQGIVAPQNPGLKTQALLQSRAFAASFGAKTLLDMQGIDAQKIARQSPFVSDLTQSGHYGFWPVLDGAVLPKNPYAALVQGQLNGVDILLGYNTDEGTIFIPRGTKEEAYIQLLMRVFGQDALEVLNKYPVNTKHSPTHRARRLVEMGLSFGGDIFADEMSEQGCNVWYYNFNYSFALLDRVGLGAMHALELFYVFDTIPKLLLRNEESIAFKEEVHSRWLNFVKNGEPNQGKTFEVQWPKYTKKDKNMLVLDLKSKVEKALRQKHVAFCRKMLWEK